MNALAQPIASVDMASALTEPFTITNAIQADANSTAHNTRFLLWDVDTGALQRVSVGANDSGGTGFKVLRIPN